MKSGSICRVWRKLYGGSEIKAHHVSRSLLCRNARPAFFFLNLLLFITRALLVKWKRIAYSNSNGTEVPAARALYYLRGAQRKRMPRRRCVCPVSVPRAHAAGQRCPGARTLLDRRESRRRTISCCRRRRPTSSQRCCAARFRRLRCGDLHTAHLINPLVVAMDAFVSLWLCLGVHGTYPLVKQSIGGHGRRRWIFWMRYTYDN
jgi:hypothetical protein